MGAHARAEGAAAELAAVRLLQQITVVSNEAASFGDAIAAALDLVCSYTGWPVGHAYLLDPRDESTLDSTSLWHVDDAERFAVFQDVTEEIPLRIGIGLPGRVLEKARPAWVEDVKLDDNFPRAHTGREIVVRAGFAFPVLSGSKAVAVLEFFSDQNQPCDEALLELMTYVGTQLGRVQERDTAAVALLAQVEHSMHLISSAYDAFVSIDQLGRVTEWNNAAEAMFGWARDEVLGGLLADVIIPERYREAHTKGIERYLATGRGPVLNKRLELSALHRSGTEFPIDLAVWPVGRGRHQSFCAFIRDITERKHAERELVAAEGRLLAAQQMARVGSWEWDLRTGEVVWSDQLFRNFGVATDTFTPSYDAYMSLVHPDDRDRVAGIIAAALDAQDPYTFEHRSVLPDGTLRIQYCTGEPIVEDGEVVRVVGTNQDVTARVEAEEAIREAYEREREIVAQLRELDRVRTQFVSSVSHELRTPLTSIIGYLELLGLDADVIPEPQREMLDVIDRNSKRLLALIEDLLMKSKLESGTLRVERKYTPVAPIVRNAVQAVAPDADVRGIAVLVSIAEDVGTINGDPELIDRLLLNLLSNAIKFTPKGSVAIDAHRTADEVVLAVSDTGIGIPTNEIPQLFSPFFRSSNAERAAPGTGLGLVIVKGIVDQHDGAIDVQSSAGNGTTVTVRLPVTTPHTLSA